MHTTESEEHAAWVLRQVTNLRERKTRERSGLHYVEGFRNFLTALDAGISVDTIVYSEVLTRSSHVQKQVRLAKRAGHRVVRVSPEQFRSVCTSERASGVGAILRQHWAPLRSVESHRGLCWIALRSLRSNGNFGTLLRTADAVGAAGVILCDRTMDPFNPDVVRASMGGIFRLRLARTSLKEFAAWAKHNRCTVLGASPKAARAYTEVPLAQPLVVMFGEERKGLGDDELDVCTELARIPMAGGADSLNVAVAAGVMLYEVQRRRGLPESRPSINRGSDSL